ncbi:DUF7146 domain-containing protein [Falsiroseomonas bella]|nr:toprim domain-containing protein [Falsiroseomonas bella]
MRTLPTAAAIADMLAERMPELARELHGEPTHRGRETWRFRARGSLSVEIAGPKRGSWYDHEAGEGGDALALVAHAHGTTMSGAFRWALGWLGLGDSTMHPPERRAAVAPPEPPRGGGGDAKAWSRDLAARIWREAVAPAGTLVETYLAARGLEIEHDAPIRFHPRAWRNRQYGPDGPAMVALMTDPATNAPCGTHVTYLQPDGSGKAEGKRAKIMLGDTGCIRLVPDADVTMGLGLAEGIETALAVMQHFQWRPVWAATSAGAIARFPVLPGLALTVFSDMDEAGSEAAQACASRWAEAGREVHIYAAPAGDFADLAAEHAA